MISLRVTPVTEEEVVEVEGVEEEGGTAEVVGSSVSTRGRFGRNCALLRRIELAYMAPMMVKRRERGE